jgi:hypothetical protein
VSSAGALSVSGSFTPSPIQYVLDGVDTEVLEDTVTPANNRPLPVKLVGAAGSVTITASELEVHMQHDGAAPDSVRIGDGVELAAVTASNELSVLDSNSAAIKTAVEIMDDWDESDRAKVNPIVGQAGVQGGSGSVSANTQRVVLATDVALPAGSNSIGTLGANSGVDIGDVTINNAAGGSAVNIQDGGNSITVDGAVTATDAGHTLTEFVRNDYSSVNVTTAAYVQLIASTSNTYKEIEIFDSSGQTLKIATGAAASEVDKFLVFPGGNGRIKLTIPSGTRISIRAVSATASTGEISVNLYG